MRMQLALLVGISFAFAAIDVRADGLILASELDKANRRMCGRVIDFTHNHGRDRRIWSEALCQKRDMYVYVPPCYDPAKRYPLAIFLHGASQDEQFFIRGTVQEIDRAIARGVLPPTIVVAPDGSQKSRPAVFKVATFWANTDAGRFEDYVMEDVWNFLMREFPIVPERDGHAMIGASAGGTGAFNCAIKNRDRIKIALGFMPALNLRWVDCHERYRAPFNPCCWGWREKAHMFESIGRPKGLFALRYHNLFGSLVGYGAEGVQRTRAFNPVEVMEEYDLKPGELDMFVGYGGKDELNIMAQVESFLYVAKMRGIEVGVAYDPNGRHDEASARRLFPEAVAWVAPLLKRYR